MVREEIRSIQTSDKDFWFSVDKLLPEAEFAKKVCDRQGYGRKLMEYWEKDMKAQGYSMVLTSTQVDEQTQHFYRKSLASRFFVREKSFLSVRTAESSLCQADIFL